MNRWSALIILGLVIGFLGGLSGCSEQNVDAYPNETRNLSDTGPVLFDSTKWIGGLQTSEPDVEQWVNDLQSTGMNTVEVTTYAKQGAWNSDDLKFPDPSDTTLQEIRAAKRLGMQVVLVLHVDIDKAQRENDFIWHGMIFPGSEADLKSWFSKYQQFTTMWAEIAEQEGVDMLLIGSELNSLFATIPVDEIPQLEDYLLNEESRRKYEWNFYDRSHHIPSEYFGALSLPGYEDFGACLRAEGEKNQAWAKVTSFLDEDDRVEAINRRRKLLYENWKNLIAHTRTIYSGKLSVAANFDNYKQIDFWEYLDCLSINAYFPLRTLYTGGEEVMFNSWLKVFDEINEFRAQTEITDRPVFFSELGYAPYSGATICPWSGSSYSLIYDSGVDSLLFWRVQEQDTLERNAAVTALVKAVKSSNFPLQGVLYWKFTTQEFSIETEPYGLKVSPNSPGHIQRALISLND